MGFIRSLEPDGGIRLSHMRHGGKHCVARLRFMAHMCFSILHAIRALVKGAVYMLKVVSNSWALFFGLALIMLGNGLQGSLLGVRASIEGFGVATTGLVMSGYYIGLLAGSSVVPKLVGHVGHVRSFGVLASLASSSILVHAVFIDPSVWWVMRFVTGFSYAGLYIVAESWLNDASENDTRGQLLSFYMLVSFGGLAGGQFLLNIADPSSYKLFILISVFVSLALVPILASAARAPAFETAESVSIAQLYRISPLGVGGLLITGVSVGAIFSMGSVYASSLGLPVREISFALGSMIMGGMIMQFPLGRLSDVFGRRQVIVATCVAGAAVAFFAAFAPPQEGWRLYVLIGLVGGLALPLYSLCVAHTNDYLDPRQMVAASGAVVLVNGIGAAIGAPLTAFAMEAMGPSGFYVAIGASLGLVALFALWRSTRRSAIPAEEQGDFVAMAPTPLSAAMNPDLELEAIEAVSGRSAASVEASFERLEHELADAGEEEGED